MTAKELLVDAIARFNAKSDSDEKLRGTLDGITRKVQVEISDEADYHFQLADCKIAGLESGAVEAPDVRISTDSATLSALMSKSLSPFKAYATGKLKVKASLTDLMMLRSFLSGR